METFSIKSAISHGWQKTKEKIWFILGVMVVYFLFNYHSNFGKKYSEHQGSEFWFPLALFSIFVWIIGVIISIGVFKIFLKLERNESANFSDLIQHYKLFLKYVLSHIVTVLVIIVGFILLIFPGIIFALRYSMVPWLVVDKELWPFPALKESSKMTYGHKWQLLKFYVVLLGVNILGLLALGVGLLVSVPVSMFAMVHVYNKLLNQPSIQAQKLPIEPGLTA